MRRDPIALVWLAGLGLAVLLTVYGPSVLGFDPGPILDRIGLALHGLSEPALRMIRGFAIAAFAVFVVLCVLARRRGRPAMAMAIVVSLLFVILAGGPDGWSTNLHAAHWPAALLVSLVGALLMTGRLRR
ncbi:hypothetical protein NFI95_08450 [Acetobacteraceae bacterium KSS8]|uniref:DUF998 domain-containing protein n=1 Tax=Endosaccharibacter trunci TaxID=2812733 RepID=A0ABT1W6H9_9PROT|nr:hypothetical protein [Acetobacteraceae bacterium KSS8]